MTPHTCTCSAIVPTERPSELALYTPAPHVHRQLLVHLQEQGVKCSLHEDCLLVQVEPFLALKRVSDLLTPTEHAEIRAAPVQEGRPLAWEALPLPVWVTRLETPWFADSTQHLLFHAQPIVDLRQGQVAGYEALVRSAPPGQFYGAGPLLNAAVAHGQGRAFDSLARTSAIEQVFPRLPDHAALFINFLPGVVYNPNVCLNTTFQACARTGADLGRLVFEVVESESFPDLGLLKSILDRYRAEGARVALDDLGGGYTSLSYLQELQPDIVKLDRTLIRDLTPDDPRMSLVGALIRYAHDLGVEVVAEGIETRTELHLVRELQADYAQGYHLGRPQPEPAGLTDEAWQSLAAF